MIDTLIIPLLKIVIVLNATLVAVTYMVLLERKVIAWAQSRLGPMRVGPHGLLQPIADALKLMIKEDITPDRADRLVFWVAPCLALVPALVAFAVVPFSGQPLSVTIAGRSQTITPWVADVNIGIIYILAISSLGVFGIVLGGWASNSKYPLLGGLRSAAQMVSYEVPLGLSIIGVLMLAGTASMVGIVQAQARSFWVYLPQIVGLLPDFVSGAAETNRGP